eukprot:scaffold494_cov117-Isochrysis_galbana.AAC.15
MLLIVPTCQQRCACVCRIWRFPWSCTCDFAGQVRAARLCARSVEHKSSRKALKRRVERVWRTVSRRGARGVGGDSGVGVTASGKKRNSTPKLFQNSHRGSQRPQTHVHPLGRLLSITFRTIMAAHRAPDIFVRDTDAT